MGWASYASTMRATSGLRTTSALVKRVKAMPLTRLSTRSASIRPDICDLGRSIWLTSPVITALAPKPMRVRNIFICSGVVFCASSRITKALLSVRPRMKANGALSSALRSNAFCTRSKPIRSYSASYSGRRYGSTFCDRSPGRKPRRSPASTAGRVSTLRCAVLAVAGHHQLDGVGRNRALGHLVERLQQFHGLLGLGLGAVDLELLVAVRDADLQAGLDAAQVRVHRAAKVRQPGVVVRGEGVANEQVDNPVVARWLRPKPGFS